MTNAEQQDKDWARELAISMDDKSISSIIADYVRYEAGKQYSSIEVELFHSYLISRFQDSLAQWITDYVTFDDRISAIWEFPKVTPEIALDLPNLAERYINNGDRPKDMSMHIHQAMISGIGDLEWESELEQGFFVLAAKSFSDYFAHTFLKEEIDQDYS